jgi:hypothetical protein
MLRPWDGEGSGAAKSLVEWVISSRITPSVIVSSEGLSGTGVLATVARAPVVCAPRWAVGPDGLAFAARSADVCGALSGTTSSGLAAAAVPCRVPMARTSRGSRAGEPASADALDIDAGGDGGGGSSVGRSLDEPSFDAIAEGGGEAEESGVGCSRAQRGGAWSYVWYRADGKQRGSACLRM